MFYLDSTTKNEMLLGATFLATGGGCPLDAKQTALGVFDYTCVPIKDAGDLHANQTICTVYAVGSAGDARGDYLSQIEKGGVTVLEYTQESLAGFFVGETGAEHLAFLAAHATGLAVVDADSTGGRAVPEITQDLFIVHGVNTLPAFLVDKNGNVRFVRDKTAQELELIAREISQAQEWPVIIFDHIVPADNINLLHKNCIKDSIALGHILKQQYNDILSDLAKANIHFVGTGKLCKTLAYEKDGFLSLKAVVANTNNIFTLQGKNEWLTLLQNNKRHTVCPDSIMLTDNNFQPIHNSELTCHENKTVLIFTKPSDPIWKSEKGLSLFSPDRLLS